MAFMPFHILGIWLRGLLAIAVLAAGGWLLHDWWQHRHIDVVQLTEIVPREPADTKRELAPPPGSMAPPQQRVEVIRAPWQVGLNRPTLSLVTGLGLLTFGLGGGLVGSRGLRVLRGASARGDAALATAPRPTAVERIRRPDGTELHVELYGPADGPVLVFTHGWGLDGAEWAYVKQALAPSHRLIVWDLPGLGQSRAPANDDWSQEKLAGDLDAVLRLAGDRPAVLVGHSIGGMIALTFCRLFPEALGRRVGGLVLVHSTYTNPVRTATWAGLYTALQKPVLEPLLHLTIWLAPLARAINWLSYINGSAHRSTQRSSFSGAESSAQLNFIAQYTPASPPAVIARGMLGMLRFDATSVLDRIPLPTLVVAADDDRTCTPEASAFMTRAIPTAKLVTLTPARHGGHFEHHDAFVQALAAFAAPAAMTVPERAAS